jgi:dTDP-glucose 4,6-dehydratase
MNVADYIVSTLSTHGISHVFMVTGGAAMHLNDAFGRNSGIKKVYCHHEQSCAMAAESYEGAPDTMDQNSAYGEGKRVGELLCAMAHQQHGLETMIARCFAFVGPHLPLDAHFAIGNFIRDAVKGDPIKVKNGTPYRSYLYAADLAIWLWTILFRGEACFPYNVGSDQEITIADQAQIVASTIGVPTESSPPNLTFPVSQYVPSVERAASEMGLRVQIPMRESLLRFV